MTIPFLQKRLLYPLKDDLSKMLLINDSEKPLSLEDLSTSLREQVDKINTGSVALVYKEKDDHGDLCSFVPYF